MEKQGKTKAWGETEEVFNNGIISVHIIKINKGGHCSEHRHVFKSNKFYVIKGNLQITSWDKDNNAEDTVLWEGESCEILPGIFHKFKALTNVECIEIYETKLRGPDIERRTEGGSRS